MKLEESDLILAFIGGLLISVSTSLHLYLKGRITGMSGAFFGLLSLDKKSIHWKATLICSMIVVSSVFFQIFSTDPYYSSSTFFDVSNSNLNPFGFLLAGLFVGFGTKLANGCTSGHGVCGLSRLSIRSFVAVPIFLLSAVGVASLRYHEPFLDDPVDMGNVKGEILSIVFGVVGLTVIVGLLIFKAIIQKNHEHLTDIAVSLFVGTIFALGLLFSGMTKRSKVLDFLSIKEEWDPSLLIVLVTAVAFNLVPFYLIKKKKYSFFGDNLDLPENSKIDWKLIVGSLFFGIGWGLGGVCPGPAFMLLPVVYPGVFFMWFLFLALGMGLAVPLTDEKVKMAIKLFMISKGVKV